MKNRPLVAANWKMNGSRAANEAWLTQFSAHKKALDGCVVCAPPRVSGSSRHALLATKLERRSVAVQAGANGRIAAEMLKDDDCAWVMSATLSDANGTAKPTRSSPLKRSEHCRPSCGPSCV